MTNPYAPRPPSPPNPYAVPASHSSPYAGARPSDNPFAGSHTSQGFNPYAPPSDRADSNQVDVESGTLQLAERGTRLGAALLDGLVVVLGGAIGLVALPFGTELAIITGLLGAFAVSIYVWYLVATTGQSLGKRWLGIRIVKLDGSLPGFFHGVFLRVWVMSVISGMIGIIGLVDVLLIFGDDRRCIHDHIASTRVVIAD